ncbi:MAG: cytochrome c-type biogenesis protein CcmH [Myxococcota bacterium]
MNAMPNPASLFASAPTCAPAPPPARARASLMLGLIVGIVFFAGATFAEGWGYDLGGELMSPFCPGRTLSSCPSPQAAELVQWIVTQEAAGATQEEVIEILIERFGEEILGAPPAKGITLWAYVFPVVGFLALGGFAFVVLRNIVGGGGASPQAAAPVAATPAPSPGEADAASDEELAALVDAEIARRG